MVEKALEKCHAGENMVIVGNDKDLLVFSISTAENCFGSLVFMKIVKKN